MAKYESTTVLPSSKIIDLTGKPFGLLKVLEFAEMRRIGKRGGPKAFWRCLCTCGEVTVVASSKLRNGHTRSCGCLAATHGKSKVLRQTHKEEYGCFVNMWRRCTDPKNPAYPYWGGRGITVGERWQNFDAFLEDMGQRPSPGHSIDRIDNEGNYTPSNCRWGTPTEQARNTRHIHTITFNGITQCISAWAEDLGLTYPTLQWRLQQGWSFERALQPPKIRPRHNHLITFQGETILASEWAKRVGLSYPALSYRLQAGWPIEKALTQPPAIWDTQSQTDKI